jgi:HSP20 family protein
MTLLEKQSKMLPDIFSGFFDDDRFLNFDFRKTWPTKVPAANVFEHEKDFIIHLAVPGMTKEDFHMAIDHNNLVITAEIEERSEMEEDEFTRREYNFSSFKRTFMLPDYVNPDKVEAKYEAGILKILIPKDVGVKIDPKREIKIK